MLTSKRVKLPKSFLAVNLSEKNGIEGSDRNEESTQMVDTL